MWITRNNKLGFIHIPKCAGTSMKRAFLQLPKDSRKTGWGIDNWMGTHTRYSTWIRKANERKRHARSEPEKWFTIVRHPCARAVSYYYFQITSDEYRLKNDKIKTWPKETFEKRVQLFKHMGINHVVTWSDEFVSEMQNIDPKNYYWNEWLAKQGILSEQFLYIEGCNNIKIFKTEKIEKCYSWLKEKYDLELDVYHANSSKHGLWQEELSQDTIEILFKKYSRDFKQFGYKP